MQFLPTKIDMYFHVIGIKEVKNEKYNINIVLESESISIAKDFLYFHNIVILNISEYTKPLQSFGNLAIVVKNKPQNIKIISSFDNIYHALEYFMIIGFDIIYTNFTNEQKLSDNEISEIIRNTQEKVKKIKEATKQELQQQKEKERKIYKDNKLNKILDISLSATQEVDLLLNTIDTSKISPDKIRDIKLLSQELTKLRMGRNVNKMVEVLESTYQKIYEIQQESVFGKTPQLLISGSSISDVEIEQEYFKYQKAQNIKKIGTRRSNSDSYYLSFETTGIYLKFLFKDLKKSFKNIYLFFFNLFDFFEIFFIFTTLILVIYIRFSKISYSISQDLFLYYFLIQAGVFGFFINITKLFRTKSIKINILLIIVALTLSYFILGLLKNNLSF
ncbi:MAG TPA: hypothetical protein PLP73_00835 [Candidatus Absconditabacterales bacterium]|nr:hypothetical protein [Candidatus Absconditabacterales bacterium]HRU50120.1 hypothetical protein [Candidatus Absconditabacterales bacterium]